MEIINDSVLPKCGDRNLIGVDLAGKEIVGRCIIFAFDGYQ